MRFEGGRWLARLVCFLSGGHEWHDAVGLFSGEKPWVGAHCRVCRRRVVSR